MSAPVALGDRSKHADAISVARAGYMLSHGSTSTDHPHGHRRDCAGHHRERQQRR